MQLNRRVAESDLLIYVNVNFVPMNGGHKSVATGLTDYARGARAPQAQDHPREPTATWSRRRASCYSSNARIDAIVDQHMKVFHIETALNNRMFGAPTEFLGKNEEDFTEVDRLKFQAMRFALSKMPRAGEAQAADARCPRPTRSSACTPARPSRCTRRRWS